MFKNVSMIGVIVSCLGTAVSADVFQQTLTSTRRNIHIPTWEVTSQSLTPGSPAVWSVRKLTLHGGKQEGVELIVIDNGRLQMTVIPTRGMGIFSVTMGDVRLGWDSPVREIVHPSFVNLHSRNGLGWLEGFNEWLCRCGLEFNGHPGPDKFIDNVGNEATMDLTLHGKIANLPAQEVEVVVDLQPPYRIAVRGRVDERLMFGPKLELRTEISTEPSSNRFRVADVVTNHGAQAQEFQMLYHCNFGRPLLEAGSTFLAPVSRVTPFNEHAAKGIKGYAEYGGPQVGFVEQVYCLRLLADERDRTCVMLRNKAGDRAVSMTYSVKELPYLSLWKNTAAESEGYVTGIEPGTNFSYTRRIERSQGRVPKLAPGASYPMTIDWAIHVGADEVRGAADRIAAIQGSKTPTLDTQPEQKE